MAPGKTWAQIAAGKQAASVALVEPVGCKNGTDVVPSNLPSLLATHASVTEASCPNALDKQVICERDEDWCMLGAVVPPAPGLPDPCFAVPRPAPGLTEPEMDAASPMDVMADGVVQAAAADVEYDEPAPTALVETQTAMCVPEPVEPLRDDMSSTAASERERFDSCILCSGSGLLCDGLLSDACPLCDSDETAPEVKNERSSSSSVIASPDGLERSPETEVEHALEDAGPKECSLAAEDESALPRPPALHVVSKEGTKMTAPPGIGPPGIWIWPHDDQQKGDAEAASEDAADRTVDWPESSVDSFEVEFVGRVAQGCFGPEFLKMSVSWADTFVEGKRALSVANLELHLEPTAPGNFLAPLVRLAAMLTRDQKFYQCQIFRMDRSKDNSSMHITCAKVSTATCWDVLKSGYCPRANCTWEHPAPSVISVSVAGGPPAQQTPLTTLMHKSAAESGSDKVEAADFFMVASDTTQLNQLNFGAFDDFTDSDESEEM